MCGVARPGPSHVRKGLKLICIREKMKAKVTLYPLGSQGIHFTFYIKVASATKIVEKDHFRSDTNESLGERRNSGAVITLI